MSSPLYLCHNVMHNVIKPTITSHLIIITFSSSIHSTILSLYLYILLCLHSACACHALPAPHSACTALLCARVSLGGTGGPCVLVAGRKGWAMRKGVTVEWGGGRKAAWVSQGDKKKTGDRRQTGRQCLNEPGRPCV